jgi:hypothetical protein
MTRHAAAGNLVLMVERSELETLTIKLRPGANPIGGVVIGKSEETPFCGWIELVALIEATHARTTAAAEPSEKSSWTAPR